MKARPTRGISRRHFVLCAAGLTCVRPIAAQAPGWSRRAALPLQTQELYPAVHGNRLWVAGGITPLPSGLSFSDGTWSYDPVADQWDAGPVLPEERHHAAMVSTGEQLYIVGGFHGTASAPWQMLDSVLVLREDRWEAASTMPQPQAEGVLAHRGDGIVHLVTGQSRRGTANAARSDHIEVDAHWRWDTGANRWDRAAPIPTPRNSATGGWIGDLLIVAGGRTAEGNLDTTEIYDGKEDRWRTLAPMPLPQAGTGSVIIDDSLVVFGGEIFQPEARVFPNVWRYLLSEDRWIALPALPTPRHGIGAGLIGRTAFVVGGATSPSGRGTSDRNEALTFPG
ncbi:MAG: kelch repeat-containing protein [Pseudomonadota bacterium]